MGTVKTMLTLPYPVSLRSTVRTHGWVSLAPWGWDDSACVLWRSDRLSSGRTARIQATQPEADRIEVAGLRATGSPGATWTRRPDS